MSRKRQKDPDNELVFLRKENRRLRAENYALKEELRAFGKSKKSLHDAVHISLTLGATKEKLFSKKSYASFIIGLIRSKSFYTYYKRLVYVVKKYTFITTSLKIFAYSLALIQSSALFVILAGAMTVAAPITLLLSYLAAVITFLFRRRITSDMRALTKGKCVTVFFPPKERAFDENSYFRKMVKEASKRENSLAVIVSPHYFSPRGLSPSRKYYLATRKEYDGVIIMRNHYFFTFKNKILPSVKDATLIF